MIKPLRFLLVSCLLLPFMAQGQTGLPTENDDSHPYGYEQRFYEKLKQGNTKGVGDNYDLKYHRFNWWINPDTCYIEGSVASYFVTKTNGFTNVRFELSSHPQMVVDSVIYGGAPVTFTHTSNMLDINIGTSLAQGVLDSVRVYYHGNPAPGMGFGAFIQSTHNGTPIIWTLSEPYGAREWWPCKNILSDKIDSIDIIVTTPNINRVASNGILVSEVAAGGNKTFHWKHRYPIAAYLIAIAVTNYAAYTDLVPLGSDTLEMLNYVFPENLSSAMAGTAAQVAVLQLYDSLFGDYPFMNEKYGHAQFGWGGGMEHQTMSFVVNFGFDLCAHEMAHQWYGDAVTCGSWKHIWVNEGFATYSQGLSLEYLVPSQWMTWKKQRIASITSLPDGSVYCTDTTSVSRIFDWRLSYQKGAYVLHMLRWIIGDSAFYAGMKAIVSHPLLSYNYAVTSDIQNAFETASGMSLGYFFDDWIYGQGHPIYTLDCFFFPDSSVVLTINQTQSHPSVPYFELPVPMRFKNAQKDTILVFNNTHTAQTFFANPGFLADSVFFDPGLWLLCQLDTLTTHVEEISSATSAHVFPNPAKNWLEIRFNSEVSGKVEAYDITGKICLTAFPDNANRVEMDISGLAKGSYIIKILTRDQILTSRFIKF